MTRYTIKTKYAQNCVGIYEENLDKIMDILLPTGYERRGFYAFKPGDMTGGPFDAIAMIIKEGEE
jgi:hypothetical protein